MNALRIAAIGLAAGALATMAKTKAEQTLQPLGETWFPPSPAAKTQLGADAAGHGENMPPSELVDRVQHAFTGDELTDEQRQKSAPYLHWAMGLGGALTYAFAAERLRWLRTGGGLLAGTLLFAGTHGSLLPLAGLQHPRSRCRPRGGCGRPARTWCTGSPSTPACGCSTASSPSCLVPESRRDPVTRRTAWAVLGGRTAAVRAARRPPVGPR